MEVRRRQAPQYEKSAKGAHADAQMAMPREDANELRYRKKKRAQKEAKKGILWYSGFLFLFFVIPVALVLYNTPFFVVQNLRCRARDHLWLRDSDTHAMAANYQRYFDSPPLYLSALYNQTMHWGTYDPSSIFAIKSRAGRPMTVGLAWYDPTRLHPLRQGMPFMHNKVNAPRATSKKGADPEVMQVRWVIHDGIHYAKEAVLDPANRAAFDVEFLKSPSGLAWHVRVHGRVESPAGLEMVLFVVNDDDDTGIEVRAPQGEHNDGDWTPVLSGLYVNSEARRRPFTLRVYDDHNPLFDTQPWRIYGLRGNASEALALSADDTVGGTVAEREQAKGRGIASGETAAALQRRRVDLRDLPPTAFVYIDRKEPETFRTAPDVGNGHNIIIMKKFYDTDFRWELSLSPAHASDHRADPHDLSSVVPEYEALSTCQLTNMFRNRAKSVDRHALKIFEPWSGNFNISKKLYMYMATQALGESFGSLAYDAGRYLEVPKSEDEARDARGEAVQDWAPTLSPASHEAAALALVGSRTDEAFGQMFSTGLFGLFLVRWNKEIAKDVVASWVLGSQNPSTGFVPTRATFTATSRSLAPRALRYEHPTFGAPPTVLLALRELLREMERKGERLRSKKHGLKKTRNTSGYYERETAADRQYLEHLLVGLKRWRRWWHETQCGSLSEEGAHTCGVARTPLEQWPRKPTSNADTLVYRWRSRDGQRLPASGMPDYPRQVCAGQHELEAHVDLFSWVALLSQLITQIEERHLSLPPSVTVDWDAHLRAAHWDTTAGRYSDRAGCAGQPFSPYVGYASLYPVLLGITKDADAITRTIDLARRELWTPYGLMSVSYASVRQAREDGLTHSNVYSGYVWPSANLMWLYSIRSTYAAEFASAGDMYTTLHKQVVETIRHGARWWEYFNPVDGTGKGSKTYVGTYALLPALLDRFE